MLKWSGEREQLEAKGCTGVALLCRIESVMGIVSGGIPEKESKKEVKAACCYGNNGGQGVLKCHYNGLLCFGPDTPHEVIMVLYSGLHIQSSYANQGITRTDGWKMCVY